IEHVDTDYDVALLKLGEQLDAISLQREEPVPLGSWLVTPGLKGRPLSIGVSSVASRVIEGQPGVLGVQIDSDETRAMIVKIFPNSGAEKAGLRENDVIVKVMKTDVSSLQEIQEVLAKHRAGEIVKATVLRENQPVEVDIRLGMREDIFFADERFGSGNLNGELSLRRNDFPMAIQHDSVLQPEDCGGPVTDSSGNVVGINIARADRVATYALPIDVVRSILKKFNDDTSDDESD
ncbi:MAG: PDZ domain-containing protein, partial [Planctomycetia bacterium]|nr:PDZ domain-containing protein [Planctomycetia bacterium]